MADELFHHFDAATARPRAAAASAAARRSSRRTRRWGSRCRRTRSTTSSNLHAPRTRPDRRRADDVRAGELGALPAQDLQRAVDHRRRAARGNAVRDDPHHACGEPAGNGARVSDNAAVLEGRAAHRFFADPHGRYRSARGADALSGEGRNPQSPDRDLAVPRRRDRCGRRDSRRGCDRARCETESWARGLRRLELAPPGPRRAVGVRLRQTGPDRLRARDHARRPGRRRRVQQRIRAAEPRRVLPRVRDGGGGRRSRLSQADHDRRRRRERARRARPEERWYRRAPRSCSSAARAC